MEDTLKSVKHICTFCHTPIKNEDEEFLCPSCNSPYHYDCWTENKGCAVYGCGEKIADDKRGYSLRESIINIEYLINRNQYSEAIYEAKQLLKLDKRNTELKNLYNKAVTIINTKINLMTSADEAFGKKDYKAAEVYYRNVLQYADEVEANFVNTRLEIAQEKIPEQRRRRVYQNILIIVIILAILTAIGYLGYYTFVLREDRDFSEILRADNPNDLASLEKSITTYENFLRNYPDGKNKSKALAKINDYSYKIAGTFYKDDWKLALKYFKKISSSMESSDSKIVFNNIYNAAYSEYKQKISNAKKYNSASQYSEALNELSNSKLILTSFPDADIKNEKEILETNVNLLNKKISSIIKYNDLEREIREQERTLKNYNVPVNNNVQPVEGKIKGFMDPDIYLLSENQSGKLVALKSKIKYETGDKINIECIRKGNELVSEGPGDEGIFVPLYVPLTDDSPVENKDLTESERDGINERLRNLRNQKSKIDSLLSQNLL